jgi:hypothetical protein
MLTRGNDHGSELITQHWNVQWYSQNGKSIGSVRLYQLYDGYVKFRLFYTDMRR